MKLALILSSLVISFSSLAQSASLESLKKTLTERKLSLETVKVGMSKKEIVDSVIYTNSDVCKFQQVSTQSILKIDGDKMIVLSENTFVPKNLACDDAEIKAFTEKILFYQTVPSLVNEIESFDALEASIKSIQINLNTFSVTLEVESTNETGQVIKSESTLKYDLSRPLFSYLSAEESTDYSMASFLSNDIELSTVDLKDVLFCENNDGDNSDCVQGDFSDILF